MNINIRNIFIDDLNEIFTIEKSCYKFPWTKKNLADEISKPNTLNLCISADSSLAGYCFSYIIDNEMFITNICIHPDYRKKYLGTFLLKRLLDEAKKRSIGIVFLEVREKNFAAIKLYEKFGFFQDCIRKNFYSNGDNAILMHLDLT